MVNSASKREQRMLAYYAEREQNRRSQSLRDNQLVYLFTKTINLSTCQLVNLLTCEALNLSTCLLVNLSTNQSLPLN